METEIEKIMKAWGCSEQSARELFSAGVRVSALDKNVNRILNRDLMAPLAEIQDGRFSARVAAFNEDAKVSVKELEKTLNSFHEAVKNNPELRKYEASNGATHA